MKKEIKTELVRVAQEKHTRTKAQKKAMEYSKQIARKNMQNNIGIAIAIIVLITLVILSGIIGSVELGIL